MNHLQNQASPYLAQHKNNPVDWWPWCQEAFQLASDMDKPIFLSIGYSSCHWCHVMAHESFEDPVTAQYLNQHFVSIKVDREERPDVDSIYMEAVQAISGSGGWPLSVFIFPDGRPFYGGTYFPPNQRGGMPSFISILQSIVAAWKNNRNELLEHGEILKRAIIERTETAPTQIEKVLENRGKLRELAVSRTLDTFDEVHGGFDSAPKFPQPMVLELLLAHQLNTGSTEIIAAVLKTLEAMSRGGIYDHLGGGFARYTVDSRWQVPHFEKMLYDQAQLAKVYGVAWTITRFNHFRSVATETINYVLRDLHKPDEGVFSSQDADSEGIEGKYYTFQLSEVENLLGKDAGKIIERYGITKTGNFEGTNILHIPDTIPTEVPSELRPLLNKLLEARYLRIPPGLDDKVILEWNSIFIATLAQLGFMFNNNEWIEKAESLLRFLENNLLIEGRWMRIWHQGKSFQPAFAADYGQLVNAYTRLGEASGKAEYILKAKTWAQELIRLFEDHSEGGLFTTGEDQEHLVVRTKDYFDSAIPSANSIGALALSRLWKLTDDYSFRRCAEKIIANVGEMLLKYPNAFPVLLLTMPVLTSDAAEIVIPGQNSALLDTIRGKWLPNSVLAHGQAFDSPLWQARNEGLAYLCKGFACLEPISIPTTLSDALDSLN